MAFVFEGLLGSSATLAILYFIFSIFLYYKLFWLQTNSTQGLNTRKLFAMSCLLTAILRCMSFSSMALLCIGRVDFAFNTDNLTPVRDDDDDNSSKGTYTFFEKALIVLFDFPDFSYISAYVLLLIVWAETYLKSRRHWLSNIKFKRFWMLSYFIFNIILYGTQIALYSLLFIPQVDNEVLMNLIYICLAGFSFFLPLTWFCGYFFLAIQFSGFPFSTANAKSRLKYLNRLGILWTFARVSWGLLALTSVVEGWLSTAQKSPLFYSILLIIIFLITEIIPIAVSVYKPVLQSLGEEDDYYLSPGHSSVNAATPLRENASGIFDTETYEDEAILKHESESRAIRNPIFQQQLQRPIANLDESTNQQIESDTAALMVSRSPSRFGFGGSLNTTERGRDSSIDSADWSLASRSPNDTVWGYFFGGH